MANPPFEPALVGAMAHRMHEAMADADAGRRLLIFVVVIPHWPDKPCWQALAGSSWTRRTLRIPQAEHGYMEGGQHYRPSLYRLANHDTSIFILQSAAAHSARPATAQTERALRQAWLPPGNG